MTLTAIKAELKRLGVELQLSGDRLHVRDPERVIGVILEVAIRIHRAPLLCELRHDQECFLMYEGDYSSEEYEAMQARHCVELSRARGQGCDSLPMANSPL